VMTLFKRERRNLGVSLEEEITNVFSSLDKENTIHYVIIDEFQRAMQFMSAEDNRNGKLFLRRILKESECNLRFIITGSGMFLTWRLIMSDNPQGNPFYTRAMSIDLPPINNQVVFTKLLNYISQSYTHLPSNFYSTFDPNLLWFYPSPPTYRFLADSIISDTSNDTISASSQFFFKFIEEYRQEIGPLLRELYDGHPILFNTFKYLIFRVCTKDDFEKFRRSSMSSIDFKTLSTFFSSTL